MERNKIRIKIPKYLGKIQYGGILFNRDGSGNGNKLSSFLKSNCPNLFSYFTGNHSIWSLHNSDSGFVYFID